MFVGGIFHVARARGVGSRRRRWACVGLRTRWEVFAEECSFLLVMAAVVCCSVFSGVFDCGRCFWQSPGDCFAWGMRLGVASGWPDGLALALQFTIALVQLLSTF